MTTRAELLEMIANGENSDVEFQRDDLRVEALAQELVAFANFAGGRVLLGVEDDGAVSGLARPGLEEWVMTACRDKIRPPLVPSYEVVRNVANGRDVAVVRVVPGLDVHALRHNNASTYLLRVGSQSREASREELAHLFQRRGALRAELQPVSGTTLADLDRRRLRNYFGDIREQALPDDDDAWRRLLAGTELMIEEHATVAGVLLFGTESRRLPHAGIDAVAYPGTEPDYAAQERAALRGAMAPLLDAQGGIVENGLVEQALHFVQRNTRCVSEIQEGGRRIDRAVYPREALREACVNALIHRDYLLTGTTIELSVYSDRLEIVSPGRLPKGVTPERMRVGARTARNEILKDVMRDYGYLEHMGMGIPRKIVKGMQEHNGTEPGLIERDERFVLRLLA